MSSKTAFLYHGFMQSLKRILKTAGLIVVTFAFLVGASNSYSHLLDWRLFETPLYGSDGTPIDSIWSTVGRDFKLDHQVESVRVQAEIQKLVADQGKLYHVLEASAPYIYFIHNQTQAHGLPAELALIPVIESEFNPNDHSKKGATGLWQLMPKTAHELGVNIKSGYDGRRNVVASTHAALNYFNDLGNSFGGDWYLAIAAYNCGPGKVESAARKTGSHSFWKLPVPRDTRYYVPRLLAVAAIVKNPHKYGVQLPPVINKPYFAEIKTKRSVSLHTLSKKSGINLHVLQQLNPDYNHTVVPTKGTYSVLVPVNKVPSVKAHLGQNTVSISL